MTVVGSQRMSSTMTPSPWRKLKIYDARVEVPPHYDTFASSPIRITTVIPTSLHQTDEPLKLECSHFLECIGR